MRKRLISTVVSVSFLVAPLHAFAHGGGLDRQGCHRETATGGYHCHRDDDDDVDWKTIGYAVGGLVLLVFVLKGWDGQKGRWFADTDDTDPPIGFTPYLNSSGGIGLNGYYNVSPTSRLGVRVMFDRSDEGEGASAGATWNHRF